MAKDSEAAALERFEPGLRARPASETRPGEESMTSNDPHRIDSAEALREIVGEPNAGTSLKVLDRLDDFARAFLER